MDFVNFSCLSSLDARIAGERPKKLVKNIMYLFIDLLKLKFRHLFYFVVVNFTANFFTIVYKC